MSHTTQTSSNLYRVSLLNKHETYSISWKRDLSRWVDKQDIKELTYVPLPHHKNHSIKKNNPTTSEGICSLIQLHTHSWWWGKELSTRNIQTYPLLKPDRSGTARSTCGSNLWAKMMNEDYQDEKLQRLTSVRPLGADTEPWTSSTLYLVSLLNEDLVGCAWKVGTTLQTKNW
jgi:hypothetical protein